jgi:translation initiation factor IF-2
MAEDKKKKPAPAVSKTKPAAKKPAKPKEKNPAKSAKPAKTGEGPAIRKQEAVERKEREAGSIAPPSTGLVSAFAFLKSSKTKVASPAITRLAPTTGLKPLPSKPVPTSMPAANPAKAAGAPSQPASFKAKPAAAPEVKPHSPAPAAKPAAPPAPPRPTPAPHKPPVAAPPTQAPKAVPVRPAPQQPERRAAEQPSTAPSQASKAAPSSASALSKLQVSSMITIRELAERMSVKPNDLIKKLMTLGVFASINQRLEPEAASIVAQDFGFELEVSGLYKEEELQSKAKAEEHPELLKPRPPVVTIMGHVDHGKTTLLDAIRQSRVAEGEAGGITQHIGAYRVTTPKGDVVFLDTPGHEAFTAMRARGAKATDIVVLVVSAADGVMPQTLEAIDHAKAAGVPIMVAVNKVDLPTANPQKIRQELASHGLSPEEWGGKTIFADVSAKKGTGIDHLLEMIGLQAELLELKANPDRPASGTVLEARSDSKRGSVATVLVQAGTLRVEDAFVAGLCHGKVKALFDEYGRRVDAAGPSTPVEILGLSGTPQAGDLFNVVAGGERQAREIAEKRGLLHREHLLAHQKHVSLLNIKAHGGKAKDLSIILKADVQGSLQALKDSLEGLSTSECRVRMIHAGLGNLTESDVLLASASDAICLLFSTNPESRATELAERDGVEVRRYGIIYDLIADVKAGLEGLLEPETVEVAQGKAEIKQLFKLRDHSVAGCVVRDGKISRSAFARVLRGGKKVSEGKIASLKRFKDDVREVEKGLECGLVVEGATGIQVGDLVECFTKETRTRRLNEPKKAG